MGEYVDYHIHSKFSDGKLGLDQIVKYMISKNVSIISITDHNTIKAYHNEENDYDIKIISGVEVDVNFGFGVQLLCYDFDIHDEAINKKLDYIHSQRMINCVRLIKKMRLIGIDINVHDNFYDNIHDFDYICKCILNHGIGNSIDEVKEKYFVPGAELYYDIPVVDTKECIKMFKKAGGKVVLAHPGRISEDINVIIAVINELIGLGLDGIECYHPDHSESLTKYLEAIARNNNMIITGGSDMHGINTNYNLKKDKVHCF